MEAQFKEPEVAQQVVIQLLILFHKVLNSNIATYETKWKEINFTTMRGRLVYPVRIEKGWNVREKNRNGV
jgi:hypothetical protein